MLNDTKHGLDEIIKALYHINAELGGINDQLSHLQDLAKINKNLDYISNSLHDMESMGLDMNIPTKELVKDVE